MDKIVDMKFRPYSIEFSGAPNSRAESSVQHGFYVDVEFTNGEIVTTCIQSWPKLGDPTLEECAEALSITDRSNPLAKKTLEWAELLHKGEKDIIAEPVDSIVSKSHYLLLTGEMPENLPSITKIKVKVGKDMMEEIKYLNDLLQKNNQLRIRLDFNTAPSMEELEKWMSASQTIFNSIDLIEDPIEYNADSWRQIKDLWGLPLAIDIGSQDKIESGMLQKDSVDVVCCKPARNDVDVIEKWCLENDKPMLFTHYMDSPLGQRMAIYEAQMVLQRSPELIIDNGLRAHNGIFKLEG